MNLAMHSIVVGALAVTLAGHAAATEQGAKGHARSFSGIASFYSENYKGIRPW